MSQGKDTTKVKDDRIFLHISLQRRKHIAMIDAVIDAVIGGMLYPCSPEVR